MGDTTSLRTGRGRYYLAVVIDLATRIVVGWRMANPMRTTLVIEPLVMARMHGHVQSNAIFHADRGTQGWVHPVVATPCFLRCSSMAAADWSKKTSDFPESAPAVASRSGVMPAAAFARYAYSVTGGAGAVLESDRNGYHHS